MKFSIKEERRDTTLCESCKNSTIINGRSFCHQVQRYVEYPVTQCSGHETLNHMDKYTASQIGWVLEVKKGKPIGFVSPAQKRRQEAASMTDEDEDCPF